MTYPLPLLGSLILLLTTLSATAQVSISKNGSLLQSFSQPVDATSLPPGWQRSPDGKTLTAHYQNRTSQLVTNVQVRYELQPDLPSDTPLQLAYSTDGTNWTSLPPEADKPGARLPSRRLTLTGLQLLPTHDLYVRWQLSYSATASSLAFTQVELLAPPAASVSGSLSVSLTGDNNSNSLTNPGDKLTYTYTLTNAGDVTAPGVSLTSPAPANSTLVSGSVKSSALARPDSYTTLLSGNLAGSSVLTNDFGLPSSSVSAFGPSATPASTQANGSNTALSDQGATVLMQPNGTFTYTPTGSFVGYDKFGYTATTNTPPNDAATVTVGVGTPVTAVANSYTITGNVTNTQSTTATGVLGNDLGNQRVVTAVNGNTANVGVAVTTAQSGTVTLAASGTFVYEPRAGYEGPDSFTYTADNGLNLPSSAVVSLTITGMIWFINNTAGAGGAGTLAKPFNTLAAFQAVNNNGGGGLNPAAGDNIFIYSGTYTEAAILTLLNSQKLIGQGATASLATITGIAPAPGSATLPATGGTAPILNSSASNMVTLGQNNLLRGLTIGTSTSFALTGNTFGTLSVSETSINNNGPGIGLNTGTVNGSFLSVTSTAGTNTITLTTVEGSFTINGGTLSGASAGAFNVNGGTVNVTYSGDLSQTNAAQMLVVQGGHSGTLTFQTGTLNATNGSGLLFDDADGTYNFLGTTTLNGGDAGISINNGSAGTFTFGSNTSITNPTGAAFAIAGGATGSTANVTYNGTISQANNADLVTISNHSANTITFQTGTLSATNGVGLQFINADGTYNINSPVTLNGGDAGIDITVGSAGTFAFPNTSITNPTGIAYREDASTATVAYNGTIRKNNNANTAVNINAKTGGTTTFGGSITASTGVANAVDLTNTGGTVNFNGSNLSITTTSGIGFNATGSGTTVNVTGLGNTITSGTGTALNVANTTIGASGLTFQSISANGGTKGIALNTTGSGGLTVTGVGTTAGSGGTIQNISARGAEFLSAQNITLKNMAFTNACTVDNAEPEPALSTGGNTAVNAAISLVSVTTVLLDRLVINGSAQQGINGHSVTDFTLSNSTLSSLGSGPDEDGLHFYNMLGTNNITNTTISSSGDDNVTIQNASGTSTINVTGGSFTSGVLGSGLLFGPRVTANMTIIISGVTCNDNFSGGIIADASNTATMDVDIGTSTITNNNDGIQVGGASGNVQFDIHNNSNISLQNFVNITILKAAFSTGGTMEGKIRTNTITTENGHTADGISVFNAGAGTLKMAITNNTINYAGTQRAILFQGGQDGAATLEGTLTGNTIDLQLDGTDNAVNGILAQANQTTPTGNGTSMCIDIGGGSSLVNTFLHSLGGSVAGGDIRVRQRNGAPVRLPGYVGGPGDTAAVVAYLTNRNTVNSAPTATTDNNLFSGGGACLQPTN